MKWAITWLLLVCALAAEGQYNTDGYTATTNEVLDGLNQTKPVTSFTLAIWSLTHGGGGGNTNNAHSASFAGVATNAYSANTASNLNAYGTSFDIDAGGNINSSTVGSFSINSGANISLLTPIGAGFSVQDGASGTAQITAGSGSCEVFVDGPGGVLISPSDGGGLDVGTSGQFSFNSPNHPNVFGFDSIKGNMTNNLGNIQIVGSGLFIGNGSGLTNVGAMWATNDQNGRALTSLVTASLTNGLATTNFVLTQESSGATTFNGAFNGNGGGLTNLANSIPAGNTTNLLANIGGTGATVAIPWSGLPSGGSSSSAQMVVVPSAFPQSTNWVPNLITNHGGSFDLLLTTNTIFIMQPTNQNPGENWRIIVRQDSVGTHSLNFQTNSAWRPTIFGQIPNFQTNANATCADIECVVDRTGTNTWFWLTPLGP